MKRVHAVRAEGLLDRASLLNDVCRCEVMEDAHGMTTPIVKLAGVATLVLERVASD